MHHAAKERNLLRVLEINQRFLEERKSDPEAGAGADNIESLDLVVDKLDFVAVKAPNRGTWMDAPMPNEVQKIRIERWVVAERQVCILRQIIATVWAL